MYLGTLESDFARSIGVVVAIIVILFALQGILLPQASYFGQVLFWGVDLIKVMHVIGLGAGVSALASIQFRVRPWQRAAFAFICWFYMTFALVLVWLVGLQAPSVVFSIMTVLIAGAIYGYLTQREKASENINGRAYRKNTVRKSIPRNNTRIRINQR